MHKYEHRVEEPKGETKGRPKTYFTSKFMLIKKGDKSGVP